MRKIRVAKYINVHQADIHVSLQITGICLKQVMEA